MASWEIPELNEGVQRAVKHHRKLWTHSLNNGGFVRWENHRTIAISRFPAGHGADDTGGYLIYL